MQKDHKATKTDCKLFEVKNSLFLDRLLGNENSRTISDQMTINSQKGTALTWSFSPIPQLKKIIGRLSRHSLKKPIFNFLRNGSI